MFKPHRVVCNEMLRHPIIEFLLLYLHFDRWFLLSIRYNKSKNLIGQSSLILERITVKPGFHEIADDRNLRSAIFCDHIKTRLYGDSFQNPRWLHYQIAIKISGRESNSVDEGVDKFVTSDGNVSEVQNTFKNQMCSVSSKNQMCSVSFILDVMLK